MSEPGFQSKCGCQEILKQSNYFIEMMQEVIFTTAWDVGRDNNLPVAAR